MCHTRALTLSPVESYISVRTAKLISSALLLVAFVLRPAPARAIEFPPPSVKVFVSSAAPGGHPDLQARIEIATGELFDQVDVLGPPGGTVASTADLGDDLIVGRLEGEATTTLSRGQRAISTSHSACLSGRRPRTLKAQRIRHSSRPSHQDRTGYG